MSSRKHRCTPVGNRSLSTGKTVGDYNIPCNVRSLLCIKHSIVFVFFSNAVISHEHMALQLVEEG